MLTSWGKIKIIVLDSLYITKFVRRELNDNGVSIDIVKAVFPGCSKIKVSPCQRWGFW